MLQHVLNMSIKAAEDYEFINPSQDFIIKKDLDVGPNNKIKIVARAIIVDSLVSIKAKKIEFEASVVYCEGTLYSDSFTQKSQSSYIAKSRHLEKPFTRREGACRIS